MKPLNLLRGGRIFKRGKHVLTSAPHFAAAAAVFVCFGADPAIADCRITGGSGNITGPNVIVCDGNGGPIGNFSAAGGIDRITVNDGAVANQISGGRDRDTIAVNGGTVNTIDGGAGNDNDSFILNGGIVGDVRAGGGDNTFRLVDTVVTGSINGGAGTDTLTVAPTADTVFATNIANIEQLIISTDSYVVTFEDGASFDFVRTHAPDENETSNVIFNGDLATPELGVQRAANGSGAVASLRRLRTNLTLNGTVDDGSGGATRITGTDGVNTVVVGATGVVNATALLDLGNDVLDVAGTLDTGAGRFQLGAGSDRLIIRDNANISGTIDGGGGADSVEVDVVATASSTLDEAVNFETLTKNGEGSLTLTGDNGFSGGVALNNGTLNVTGTLDNGSGGQTTVTGSANETTLSVGDSGTLLAEGTLGDGADVLDVAGTLDTGAGNLTLGLGDDTFRIQDGTAVTGVVDGGLGTDTIDADIATSASDAVLTQASNFETLTKNGAGALNLTGMFDFSTVNVNEGLLNVTGDLDDINVATVSSGATLTADGAVTFTDNADTFTVAGTVDGGSQIRLLDGDDNFNILGGTDVSAVVDGGAGDDTVSADIAATQSADLVQVTNFEALTKTGAGTLNVTGPGASEFSTVNANAGVLNVT
ncbi:hypothetical protein RA27_22035, partial [Ruegeria sp. ANG-R]|uniref:beta strand repeat-containing protein n=1 Tax=Ruegeria sp. ANG-R TaxID=1577903 RepID=UPI00057D3F6D